MSGATISTVINQVIDHSVLDLFSNPSLDVVNIELTIHHIDQLVIYQFSICKQRKFTKLDMLHLEIW